MTVTISDDLEFEIMKGPVRGECARALRRQHRYTQYISAIPLFIYTPGLYSGL